MSTPARLIARFHDSWADPSSGLTSTHCGHAVLEILQKARQLLLLCVPTAQSNAPSSSSSPPPPPPPLPPATTTTCDALLQTSDILIDYAYEKLHAFPYRQVPACWRELYTDASMLHALALWLRPAHADTPPLIDQLAAMDKQARHTSMIRHQSGLEARRQAIRVLDKALVLAGACGPRRRALVMETIEALETEIAALGQHAVAEDSLLSSSSSSLSSSSLPPPPKRLRMDADEAPARLDMLKDVPHQQQWEKKKKEDGREDEDEDESDGATTWPRLQFPIPRWHQPSLETFARHVHQQAPTPVILTGCIDYWPALKKWADPEALCQAAGPDRLVPIEIGSQYTDEQWTQKLVTTREFIQQYIIGPSSNASRHHSHGDAMTMTSSSDSNSSTSGDGGGDGGGGKKAVGYLAQHNLFEQIPRLRRDIDIPDYCFVGPPEEAGYEAPEDTLLNAWFGPRGTVSPLHTDPYHNLLAQAVGHKYVRLYAPSQTRFLYSFGSKADASAEQAHHHVQESEERGEQTCQERERREQGARQESQDKERMDESSSEAMMLGNTSQVDVEDADLERFPLFEQAEYVEAVLGPGELLYIPFQWWHYIRSLSVSFSVSFWF